MSEQQRDGPAGAVSAASIHNSLGIVALARTVHLAFYVVVCNTAQRLGASDGR